MTKIKLKCDVCDKEFERYLSEYKRSQRIGRHNCCSRSCGSVVSNKSSNRDKRRNIANLNCRNRADTFTPFRFFLRCCKIRKKTCDIDLFYLKEIWNKQCGICPITGWKLLLPLNSSKWGDDYPRSKRSSLDRIDNSKGYVKGNVRFISFMANICRGAMTDEEVIDFCLATSNNHPKVAV